VGNVVSLLVICPTRGRPVEQLLECYQSFKDTAILPTTGFTFALDPGTPEFPEKIPQTVLTEPTGNMRAATNQAAKLYQDTFDILGFIGDDHRFRTYGWDVRIEEALKDGGMAYGDDGVQGEALPTQWFVTSDIVRVLGWLALPVCNHFYLDNAWIDLANAAKCRHYLPDVVIEHMHFSYGKSEIDDSYRYAMMVGSGDAYAYQQWRNSPDFTWDTLKVMETIIRRTNENPH
jgi:hypothetical protein